MFERKLSKNQFIKNTNNKIFNRYIQYIHTYYCACKVTTPLDNLKMNQKCFRQTANFSRITTNSAPHTHTHIRINTLLYFLILPQNRRKFTLFSEKQQTVTLCWRTRVSRRGFNVRCVVLHACITYVVIAVVRKTFWLEKTFISHFEVTTKVEIFVLFLSASLSDDVTFLGESFFLGGGECWELRTTATASFGTFPMIPLRAQQQTTKSAHSV